MSGRRYIGGEFCLRDNAPFLGAETPSSAFPASAGPSGRFCYETGADALAALLSAQGRAAMELRVPRNFCMGSLARVRAKLGGGPVIVHYAPPFGFSDGLRPGTLVLWVHFNGPSEGTTEARKRAEAAGAVFIEDFTHAPLAMATPTVGYAFASLRKFACVDIAVAYSPVPLSRGDAGLSRYRELKARAAELKSHPGNPPLPKTESAYMELYREAEAALAGDLRIGGAQASELNLLESLDFAAMERVRIANHSRLAPALASAGLITVPGRSMYAMARSHRRDALRAHCFSQGIFPAIHWSDSHSRESEDILSFHIDQRYGQSDMDRVATVVGEFVRSEMGNR